MTNYEQLVLNKLDDVEKKKEEELKKKEWMDKVPWVVDKNKFVNHITNYELFINNHPKYAGKLKYNKFLQRPELDGEIFDDAALNYLYRDCEVEIGLSSMTNIDKVVKMLPITNAYNPVVEYLNECEKKWDGVERVSTLFIDLLDADDTELNRIMTWKWFMAAVKRVLYPGCKFDNMIILQGSGGIGKSTICELLSNGFYSEMKIDEIGGKDIVDKMNKSWFVIIDELENFNKKDMSSIKSFLSTVKDTARLAYGKMTNEYQRHCIFIGSTNEDTFLRDTSSLVERRFWVIKCNKTIRDSKTSEYLTQDTVDKIWGEVMTKFNKDHGVYLDLEIEYHDEFAKEMLKFKTSNDDDGIVILKEILAKKYVLNDKGEFADMYDFFRQVKGEGQHNFESIVPSNYINKIPITWLSQILKIEHRIDRSGKFIAQGLQAEWEYRSSRYRGIVTKSIIRINKIEEENFKIDNELPI